ncbi:MAG: hypothetical protein GY926_17955 [bacterium]|nr:hypothetical protein [bacterium]
MAVRPVVGNQDWFYAKTHARPGDVIHVFTSARMHRWLEYHVLSTPSGDKEFHLVSHTPTRRDP